MASIHIAIDAMGGDCGPRAAVTAVQSFLRQYSLHGAASGSVEFSVFAPREAVLDIWPEAESHCRLVHCEDVVEMEDSLRTVLRSKGQHSSMAQGLQSLTGTEPCDAMVSSGSTAALVALSRMHLNRIRGVEKTPLCASLPGNTGDRLMLDLGANPECGVDDLLQFAMMGSRLHSCLNTHQPRLALLNIGVEAGKGNALVKAADALLRENEGREFEYCGYIEANQILAADLDVIVCDGFSGNVALKATEGSAAYIRSLIEAHFASSVVRRLAGLMLRPALKKLRLAMDPRHFSGAVLLGFESLVIKTHGDSCERSWLAAIQGAVDCARADLVQKIVEDCRHSRQLNEM